MGRPAEPAPTGGIFSPPLLAAIAATVVLLGVVLADARRAAGHPPEAPSPSA